MREAQKASTLHEELTDKERMLAVGKKGFPHNTPFGYPIVNDQP